uniref:Uncharacterized protein n=1 Tax=Pithovirus LCPAC202 TaxID=2506592 RepID=A0A481Z687_9VIRU|nr:MAG: uncharacterized protein LCPAC202_00390 [Pithovirus LCPAC202]
MKPISIGIPIVNPLFPKYKIPVMEPIWDGSCLGSWSQVKIYQTLKRNNATYHQIEMGGKKIIVQTKQCKTPYMCMVDEMKIYFGLPKQGTHWFEYGKSGKLVKIIIKTSTEMINLMPTIINYPTLSEFKKLYSPEKHIEENFPELADRIRISFVFRVVFGIKRTNKSSLIIKWFYPTILYQSLISSRWMNMELPGNKELIWYPVSIDESYPDELDMDGSIPNTILDEWFGKKDIADVIREMCLIREYKHIQPFRLETQNKMEEVIKRVDKNLIGHATGIIQRLISRLTFGLKPTSSFKIRAPDGSPAIS